MELIERRRRLMGPAYRLFYEKPVHLVRGEGVWLYDPEGRAYLDAYNNVPCVGHCHPRVVEALARQAATLNTHTRYLDQTVLAYAERLLARFPPELSQVMFACTGSEANDLAIRIATSFTSGSGFIVTANAYHGGTQAVAQLSPSLGPAVDLGGRVRTVPAPGCYTGGVDEVGAQFAAAVAAAAADLKRHGVKPAALIVDTLFSSDGLFPEPAGLLAPAAQAIRQAGGLFIADEVQAGFCRTGGAWWGFERHGVLPDMVTLGKPMGAGYPLSGVVLRPEVVERFGAGARYFNTFGGTPVAAAVGSAVLDVIEQEGLPANVRSVGERLRTDLIALAGGCDQLGQVRGAGLSIAIDVVGRRGREPAAAAALIVEGLRDRGVRIAATGPRANVLKIRPPLIFSEANALQLHTAHEATIGSLA